MAPSIQEPGLRERRKPTDANQSSTHSKTAKDGHEHAQYGLFAERVRLAAILLWFLGTSIVLNITQFLFAPLYVVNRDYYYAAMAHVKQCFGLVIITLSQWFAPVMMRVSGDAGVQDEISLTRDGLIHVSFPERLVMIANHQIYTDWVYLWWVAYTGDMHGHVFILLKESLKYIPILGPGMMFFGFIFMARKWEKDQARMRHRIRKLNSRHEGPMSGDKRHMDPMWLLIFPEGTNLSERTRGRSREWAKKRDIEDHKHVLLPRTKGLHFCVDELGGSVEYIYDCTIGYEGVPPDGYGGSIFTLRSTYLQGRPPKSINMYWRKFATKDLPKDEEGFERWCAQAWKEKDVLMEYYYANGRFPANGEAFDFSKANVVGNTQKSLSKRQYLESDVRYKHWTELLQIFAPLGAFILVLNVLYNLCKMGMRSF